MNESIQSTSHGQLQELIREFGDSVPLDLGMALIAQDEDGAAEAEQILMSLDRLAEPLYIPEECSIFEKIARLNYHLFELHGFEGDSYSFNDKMNHFLNKVLTKKSGIPISLSVIYIELARRCKILLKPVNFPSHFLVTPVNSEVRFFIDPFRKGKIRTENAVNDKLLQMGISTVDSEKYLKPSSSRQVLVRASVQLWQCYQREDDSEGVIRNLERLIMLEPEDTPQGTRFIRELHRYRAKVDK